MKNPDRSHSAPKRLHKISIDARDDNYQSILTEADQPSCTSAFEDMTLMIATQDKHNQMMIGLIDPHEKDKNKKERICARINLPEEFFSEEHETFIFISAKAGEQHANQHVLHHIRFKDIKHLHDDEEINTPEDEKVFHGKAHDIMRKKAMHSSAVHTVSSYNQLQVQHNELYSTLVAKFISNSERVIANLERLPGPEIAR